MRNQMSVEQKAIMNMDFANADNHCLSEMAGPDYVSGFEHAKIYQSPAMAALGLHVSAIIVGVTQLYYWTWYIHYNCYIQDNYGSIQHRFRLHSRINNELYVDAWNSENRDQETYDLLFSQLNVGKLEEQCRKCIENQGLEEQE